MAKQTKAYFGLDRVITIILAIIPLTNVILGIVTRILRGKYLGAILNFVLAPVFYIIDLITVLVQKDVTVLA